MFGLILFFACIAGSAWRLMSVLAGQEREPLTMLERCTWAGLLGLALWLAQGWALALVGLFRGPLLLAGSILVLLVVIASTWKRPFRSQSPGTSTAPWADGPDRLIEIIAMVCVGAWILYSVLALVVIPVCNHDALAYHFPKAVMFALTGKFGLYPSNDLRVTYFTDNYEIMASTFMLFLHGDRATGMITNYSLLLFITGSYGFGLRVWGKRTLVWVAMPVLLASPVLLLHTTAHKNDLLMAALTLQTLIWLGRYSTRGGNGSAIIGILSLGLALGTKFHGLFLALASVLFLWQAWHRKIWRPTFRLACLQLFVVISVFLLLGSAQYAANMWATGHLMGLEQVPSPNAVNTISYPAYWQLPRFFSMLLAAPFFIHGRDFVVPWSGEHWFWPDYELYFSHYGAHITALVLLLPFSVRKVKRSLPPEMFAELVVISVATITLILMNSLIGLRPYGSFCFIPRFLLFGLPVLLIWTWCPWTLAIGKMKKARWLPIAVSAGLFIGYAGTTISMDRFTPFNYVRFLWAHPEARREIYHTSWRAASVVDRSLPENASVAFDGGYDGWSYPLYGAHLSRKVQWIPPAKGPYVPGPEIEWVAIDYAFKIIWGHPALLSMNQIERYSLKGSVSATDRRVFDSLQYNSDFRLVYYLPERFQAIFQRIHPTIAPVRTKR